jgi:hypothetical protein
VPDGGFEFGGFFGSPIGGRSVAVTAQMRDIDLLQPDARESVAHAQNWAICSTFTVTTQRSWKNSEARGNPAPNGTAAFRSVSLAEFAATLRKGAHLEGGRRRAGWRANFAAVRRGIRRTQSDRRKFALLRA